MHVFCLTYIFRCIIISFFYVSCRLFVGSMAVWLAHWTGNQWACGSRFDLCLEHSMSHRNKNFGLGPPSTPVFSPSKIRKFDKR